MIYYQYIAAYVNPDNANSTIVLTRSCEDAEYNTHLGETKTIALQAMYVNNYEAIPAFSEEIKSLTLTQFNAIVKGPDDLEINPDIIIDDETPI